MAVPPTLLKGTVKCALSADMIVIRGEPRGGPPPERTLAFGEVSGPRMMRRPNTPEEEADMPKDEPFAWQSREALRKLVVGQQVTFRVNYTTPGGREYGVVYVGGKSVTATLVSQGWLKIRDNAKGGGPDFEELTRLQSAAQDAKIGMWQPLDQCPNAVRRVKWHIDNPQSLVDQYRGKQVSAVVEQVRDSSTFRCFLLPRFEYVTIMLSGIRGPMFKRDDAGKEIPEPFAAQAKYFAETRLLQREVKIIIQGVNNNSFLGTILHPNGNISEFLLREGYAKIVDWSLGLVTEGKDKLRAAEKDAKTKRLRLWKEYTPQQSVVPAGLTKKFTATVEEIVSPECVVVKNGAGALHKLWLASVRQPRAAAREPGARGSKFQSMMETPYSFEAREFLRKKLIGQKVSVELDYVKPANEGYPEKACATIKVGGVNVADAMISKGLATTMRHRQDDEMRSSYYDDLVTAEARAVKNGKGLHGKTDPPLHKITEVTTKTQSDRFLPAFRRLGKVHGVVEYVSSGSRLKVFVPKETCMITVVLAGLSCPKSSRPNEAGEPYGDEAMHFTRSLCMQREVEIEVEAADSRGSFVGHLYVKSTNLAVALCEAGLAKLHFTADRYRNFNEITVAEASAQSAGRGLWKDYKPPAVEEAKVEPTERKCDYKKVVITEVEDSSVFWAQQVASGPELDAAMADLRSILSKNKPVPGAYSPKKNQNCVAQFSADGQWYRAQVLNVEGPKVQVLFVDYGNTETTTKDKLAPVPIGAPSIPPQARKFNLACIKPPSDYQIEALNELKGLILNGCFLLNVEYQSAPETFATLVDEASGTDVGEMMLLAGFGSVTSRREQRFTSLLAKYKEAEQEAKSSHRGMWIYGDCTEDDAKEFGR